METKTIFNPGDPPADGPNDMKKAPEKEHYVKTMDFSQALMEAKRGAVIARTGWNGKDMGVYVVKGSVHIPRNQEIGGTIRDIGIKLFDLDGHEGTVTRNPRFDMQAADGTIITGWVASQTDLLSEDWIVVGQQAGF